MIDGLTLAVIEPDAEVPTTRSGHGAVYHDGVPDVAIEVLHLPSDVRTDVSHVCALVSVVYVPEGRRVVCRAAEQTSIQCSVLVD